MSPLHGADGVVDYLADMLEGDARNKFEHGFKFRPAEPLIFPFGCHLVSRGTLVEGMAFVSPKFLSFLSIVDDSEVDDAGRPLQPLRVYFPLRTIDRIDKEMCVVKGVYNEGEPIDALLLSTGNAKHQLVWVDEFDRACQELLKAWEEARRPERADEALPVSLRLNPEFASLEASQSGSVDNSPRRRSSSSASQGHRRTPSESDDSSAISDSDADSEIVYSAKMIPRPPLKSQPTATTTRLVRTSSGGGVGGVDKSEWISEPLESVESSAEK